MPKDQDWLDIALGAPAINHTSIRRPLDDRRSTKFGCSDIHKAKTVYETPGGVLHGVLNEGSLRH